MVDKERNVIDFGDRARFDTASHQLNPEQAKLLRAFVPEVLVIAQDDLGKRWLKRIVAEGFADQRGTYLYNLNLSLQRSQRWVLCVLLAPPLPGENPMSQDQLEQIRELSASAVILSFLLNPLSRKAAELNCGWNS